MIATITLTIIIVGCIYYRPAIEKTKEGDFYLFYGNKKRKYIKF